jgi:DNA-binding response OmpR family regulator
LKTVLVVDSDLGFLAFLSKSLSQAECVAIPATTSETAISLLEELDNPKIDLLVVNLVLPNTADLATALKRKNQSLKVVAIQDRSTTAVTNIPIDARLQKPSPDELEADWYSTAKQVFGDK